MVVKARQGRVELRSGKTTKLILAGQDAAAGTQATPRQDDDDDDDDYGGWFWFGAAGYTAMVTAAIIYSVTRDDDGADGPGDPSVIVPPDPSPTRQLPAANSD